MPNDLPARPAFLMVTDTAMVRKDGRVFAFGPVVRELEVFSALFGEITWIGFNRPDMLGDPIMDLVPEQINCILLNRSGGDTIWKKLGVLVQAPNMFRHILKNVWRNKVIHTRAPSSPAFIAALLSFVFRNKIWWHKYAGNWGQENPPFFYGMQRTWLQRAYWSKVTINGHWPGQPAHCLSFENPCLDDEERSIGALTLREKSYDKKLQLCFVGRIEHEKGIMKLLEALEILHTDQIEVLHIIGDGPLRHACVDRATNLPIDIRIHGSLSRKTVGEIMQKCHFILLPSIASEGFPKVIAEGANYGCIPVVTNISSIGQYIKHRETGFLLPGNRPEQIAHAIEELINNRVALPAIAQRARQMAELFTYERYRQRILAEILH